MELSLARAIAARRAKRTADENTFEFGKRQDWVDSSLADRSPDSDSADSVLDARLYLTLPCERFGKAPSASGS